ncbi:NAD(P)H-dependent glycerol-3-phosphate dehydrogenase [Xanthovirga aplysinae]|uniref:NAD(P)H-dependent glycerol-3-phosphate dehydrogenase n=1 Tax=Xanthovirga aplysinae TaxID=2529853 RepID=UPI0012BD1AE9|nr:NAD(P)H-dependent glycerol-3-phosphate dehydrogenase [Xanthovirga aplysinae]MTI31102.1 NAD(P)-dependent glycerol-3-phosphate dehydrogenase [Xanthovirga aplysinae]
MGLKRRSEKPVGVIGAGSFGTAIANLLAENSNVLLFARNKAVVKQMVDQGLSQGQQLHERVQAVNDLQLIAEKCDVIFPVVPSSQFRKMMQGFGSFLHPYHILIHATKGLDCKSYDLEESPGKLSRNEVRTMSEVIREESSVVRIGCLAGPNLARELADCQPAAAVVASPFDEVIQAGQRLLRSERFQVYSSNDLIGIEWCGVLKNIIAIGAGALSGLGYGENARALLISRGMSEMIRVGKAFGGNTEAFLGLAGVGDLVATCSSTLSRNFTVGNRLAKGEKLEYILNDMKEVAEGVNTIKIVHHMANSYKVRAPITHSLYQVLFEGLRVEEALQYLMKYPFYVDIDFM